MKSFDISQLPPADAYQLLIGGIVPRPIAWISTQNTQGLLNLAPFSFFMGVSSHPLCLAVSLARKGDASSSGHASALKKDTLRNIEETGQFVVNTVSRSMLMPMHASSAEFDYGVNEFEQVGVHALPSVKVKPPRVKESLMQYECETYKTIEVGDGGVGSTVLVIGKILMVHVADSVYEAPTKPGRAVGKVKFEALAPASRLGGMSYGFVTEVLDIPRPQKA